MRPCALTQQAPQSHHDVLIQLVELARRIARPKVRLPTADHRVHVGNNDANIGVTAASRGQLPDTGPHLRHSTPRRPPLEIEDASPRPLPDSTAQAFAQMATEEIEALAPVREVDHPRLLRSRLMVDASFG